MTTAHDALAKLLERTPRYFGYSQDLADVIAALAERDRLAEDVAGLRRDAERYRWLRDWSRSDLKVRRQDYFPQSNTTQFTLMTGHQLDAAIDAAMKKDPTP